MISGVAGLLGLQQLWWTHAQIEHSPGSIRICTDNSGCRCGRLSVIQGGIDTIGVLQVSQSRDKTGPKKGQQMPMEDRNSPGPMARIARPTLNWNQDILEPQKLAWKLAAGDGPVMPRQTLKSVVKMLEKLAPAEPGTCAKVKPRIKPALDELTSCGRGRGWAIAEKLQELARMGPAAASHYTGKERSSDKKQSKKPAFPTLAEQEEHKRHEEHKKWVVHHQEESIGEHYISLKRQAHRYSQEIRALRFFSTG